MAAISLFSGIIAGCASSPIQSDEWQQQQKEIAQLRESVALLNKRLENVNNEVSGLSDEVRTRQTLDAPVKNPSPAKSKTVQSHPAENSGDIVTPRLDSQDPEAGFTLTAAVRSYQQATLLYRSENLSEAILAFTAFLEKNPNHPLAGSAQYYLANSYLQQGDLQEGVSELEKVLTVYPFSPLVTQATYVLAETKQKLNLPDQASVHRELLKRYFPNAPQPQIQFENTEKEAVKTSSPISDPIPGEESST